MTCAIYGWEVLLKDYRELKGYTIERFESLSNDEKQVWFDRFRFYGHNMNYMSEEFLYDWFRDDDENVFSVLEKYTLHEKIYGKVGVLGVELSQKKIVNISEFDVDNGVICEVIYNLTTRGITKEISKQIMDYYTRWKKTSRFDELFNSEYKQLLIGEPQLHFISY